MNESVYFFLPRSIFGGLVSAWRIEVDRIKKRGASILSHQIFWGEFCSIVFYGIIFFHFGEKALAFLILQTLVGIIDLECVNYIQHYGLRRRRLKPGKYEAVNVWHSWNSDSFFTNQYLIRLPMHSQHHQHPSYPYYQLTLDEKSPDLPTGYGGLIPLTLLPFVWFRLMNPKVKEVRKENWKCRQK